MHVHGMYTACSVRDLLECPEIAKLLCTLVVVLSTLKQRKSL